MQGFRGRVVWTPAPPSPHVPPPSPPPFFPPLTKKLIIHSPFMNWWTSGEKRGGRGTGGGRGESGRRRERNGENYATTVNILKSKKRDKVKKRGGGIRDCKVREAGVSPQRAPSPPLLYNVDGSLVS